MPELGPPTRDGLVSAQLYFDGPDRPDLLRRWVDAIRSALVALAGDDRAGQWYASESRPGYAKGRRIPDTDPGTAVDLFTDGGQQATALLTYDRAADAGRLLRIVRVQFTRYGAGDRFLAAHLSVSLDDDRGEGFDRVVDAVRQMFEQVVAPVDARYGQLSTNVAQRLPQTRLDLLLNRDADRSTGEALAALRGYEWLTVCPAPLAERLGGADALRATGAFHQVTAAGHGLVLQATARPDQFDADAGRRVWEALRPVLPGGRPRALPLLDFAPLVLADASG